MGTTLAEKVWNQHLVRKGEGQEPDLLYIDLHLVHEVTSPQAFDGLRLAGRPVRRPDLTVATEDHNVPTLDVLAPIADPVSRTQVETLRKNCAEFGVPLYPMNHAEQGIVHVVGPQLGLTQPGLTVVCGDSHTSTHGAFGAMAFGIGTSEVEHVLATQTLPLKRFKTMAINVNSSTGRLRPGVTSKDVILAIIAKIGTGGGQGYVLEYRGNVIENLSMEARMTICNMSIEAGARAGMIAPDETTFAYLEGRDRAPKGADWDAAVAAWRELRSDDDAVFDAEVDIDADTLTPFVTWGTNPGQGLPLGERVPDPEAIVDENERVAAERALEYMGLEAGTPLRDIHVDTVFVGSCTNGRIEDLRSVAEIIQGRKVADGVRMLVVPGSMRVRFQAEEEGLDKVFLDAGAEWRSAGCSMCLGMNPDQLAPGERSASTSNRNFEGRQGKGGRTHLVSPLVAAATAVRGTLLEPGGPELMDAFTTHTGIGVPLRRSNVDTDQIIPAVYLKRVTRTGFEDGLFSAWRNDPSFILNTPPFDERLGAGRRPGLRHRFVARARRLGADGLRLPRGDLLAVRRHLPRQLGQGRPARRAGRAAGRRAAVEAAGEPAGHRADRRPAGEDGAGRGPTVPFDIDDYTRWRLLEGLDDIGLTLRHADDITTFEATRPARLPTTIG